jgi:sensor domain CHASE-containing protein/signal transduction histidine kinase
MNVSRRLPPWLFALLSVLLTLAIEQVIEHFAWRSAINAEKSSVHERLSTIRARLEGVINANLLMVHGLTAVISAQPEIDQAGFARIARGLVDDRHALRNIAGAPNMVITLMYPLAGNEAAIGLDYRAHPTQGEAARRVMQTGQAVVAGPLPLQQGGIGIIAREPVFVPSLSPGESPRFWGLVSAVIDIDQLYRRAELYRIDPTLRLAIRGVDGTGSNGAVFFGDAAIFAQAPITKDVSLPGGSWQLAAIPAAGWGKNAHLLEQIRLLGLLSALAAGLMTWRLAQNARALNAAAQQLQESQQLFASFMQHLPAGAYIRNTASGDMLFQNRWFCEHLPCPAPDQTRSAEMQALDRSMLSRDRHARDAGRLRLEEQLPDRHGGQMHCDIQRFPIPRAPTDGSRDDLVGAIINDVTTRVLNERRINGLNRVYAVLSGINETIVRQKDRNSLFAESCRIAVEIGGFRMAWLGMVDVEHNEVRPIAHAGEIDGYLENLHISLGDDPQARGPTGTALREGQHVVCNDIANDPRLAPWRDAALALGYRSSAALPIKVGSRICGVFNLYSSQSDFFDADELRLLDELALDIGFALDYLQAEDQVRRGEAVLNSVFQALPDLFFLMDADGTIREYRAQSGSDLYTPPETFLGKRMQDVLPPTLASQFEQSMTDAEAHGKLVTYEYDLTLAHGERRFEARLSRLPDSTQLISVVRDITGPYRDRQALTESEARLRQSEDKLRQLNANLETRVAERTAELDALNQSLESFVYSVSHDLKTPLRGVEGYSRLLESDYADRLDAEGMLFLANIRDGVARMGELIDDLLAYSRMERRKLNPDRLDLTALVHRVLKHKDGG